MSQFRFVPGLHVKLADNEFVLSDMLPDGSWLLRNIANAETLICSMDDLLSKYAEGELTALLNEGGRYRVSDALKAKLRRDLNNHRPDLVAFAQFRLIYCRAIYAKKCPLDPDHLRALIDEVSEAIRKAKPELLELFTPPSPTQAYRDFADWRACHQDVRALIPNYEGRGRRTLSSKPVLGRVMAECIQYIYMVREYGTANEVRLEIERRIGLENKFRSPKSQLLVPSLSTVNRAIARIPKKDVAKAHDGVRRANIDFRTVGEGLVTERPLEVCEVDHTPSDLMVVDDDTYLPLGRPVLTGIVDHNTTSLMTLRDEYSPESSSTVARALRDTVLPKSYLARDYPSVVNRWECFGVPEILLWDNAKQFLSKHLENAGIQIGCDILYGRKTCPWLRPVIENFLGKVNRQLLHTIPGTTFSNIFDRGDYNPAENGVILASTFREILHIWAVDIYMQTPNRGRGNIPSHAWREALAKPNQLPPPLAPSLAELETALGECDYRTAFHYGVEKFSLFYNNERLGELRSEHGTSVDVEINFDRGDIGHIYVLDPKRGTYFKVRAVKYEYAKGLTLWQHEVIRRFNREVLGNKTDEIGLAEAKEKIRELIRRDFAANPYKTHMGAARFLESGLGIGEHANVAAEKRSKSLPSVPIAPQPHPPLFDDVDDAQLPVFEVDIRDYPNEINATTKKPECAEVPPSTPKKKSA